MVQNCFVCSVRWPKSVNTRIYMKPMCCESVSAIVNFSSQRNWTFDSYCCLCIWSMAKDYRPRVKQFCASCFIHHWSHSLEHCFHIAVEIQDLTNRIVDRAMAYWMKVSREKSRIMTKSTDNISTNISRNGQKLEDLTSFKYLGATLCKDDTRSAEIHIRIASAMARLNRIWRCNTISFASKFRFYKFRFSILYSDCETWTHLMRWKLAWFGHVTCHDSLSKTMGM